MFRSRSQKYKKPIDNARMSLFCMNCGKNNHGYTQCIEPLSSYGIACFYRLPDDETYKLLMVRRKHSINYVEFLRGKYDVNNGEYLVELFSGMTVSEIEFITQNPDFEILRRDLGMDNNNKKSYKAEYDNSELKFNYILNLGILANIIYAINFIWRTNFKQPGNMLMNSPAKYWGLIDINQPGIKLITLFEKYNKSGENTLFEEPEWELPKGKRQNKETDLQCAIREFEEESHLNMGCLKIYKNVIPLEEIYKAGNGVEYRNIYFIAELKCSKNNGKHGNIIDLLKDIKCSLNDNEIGDIGLFDLQTGLNKIRDINITKKNIIQKAFMIVSNILHFFSVGY